MEREPSVAVRRAVALLLTLGSDEALDAGGLGVKRLSELTGNEISRVSRTLEVLSESGLVDRDPDSRAYRLGTRLFALAARAGQPRLRQAAATFVRRLTQELGERAYLFRRAVLMSDEGLLMTPRRTDTDGFFVSILRRTG